MVETVNTWYIERTAKLVKESKAFINYVDLERHQMKISPYASTRTLKQWLKELQLELYEAEVVVDDGNSADIAEELGDLFCDTLHTILKAEQDGHCTLAGVISGAHDKICRRKPWLVDGSAPPATIDEEMVLWNKIKASEKDTPNETK